MDYDTLRSDDPADFSAAMAICLETDDTDTTAFDAGVPPVGGMFSYLPRGVNLCGEGSLGTSDNGLARSGRECP